MEPHFERAGLTSNTYSVPPTQDCAIAVPKRPTVQFSFSQCGRGNWATGALRTRHGSRFGGRTTLWTAEYCSRYGAPTLSHRDVYGYCATLSKIGHALGGIGAAFSAVATLAPRLVSWFKVGSKDGIFNHLLHGY